MHRHDRFLLLKEAWGTDAAKVSEMFNTSDRGGENKPFASFKVNISKNARGYVQSYY